MQKVPLYIGIFVEDNKSASKQIRQYVKQGISQLLQSFEQNKSQVSQQVINTITNDLSSFQQTFTSPKDNYHITILFIGGNLKKLSKDQVKIYEQFKSNKKTVIKMQCIVYVPGYLICAYCTQLDEQKCDNGFPHVTLFLGPNAKAVESNYFLEQINKINKDMLIKKEYKTNQPIVVDKKDVFIIDKKLQIKAVTGTNFTHGQK